MPRRPAPVLRRSVIALVVAPVAVALALPASAQSAVGVSPAPEGCGLVLRLTGLTDGEHVVAATVTTLAAGQPVRSLPDTRPSPSPSPVPTPEPGPAPTAVRTVGGDGEVALALDAATVPDDDPRVVVAVTTDGTPSPAVELALPGCGGPTASPPATPAASPPATPTASPAASATAQPPTQPKPTGAAAAPSASASATTGPAAASTSPAPSTSPRPSTSPTPRTVRAVPVEPASPVLTGAPVPDPASVPDESPEQHGSAVAGGTGVTGGLSLMSFTAAPQLGVASAPEPVPAPVIAAPEGSAAGLLAAPATGTPLEDLLPSTSDDAGDDTATAQLAAPVLATDAAADPLVDLAPAAFVLSASLGGLLVAGRRRSA